MRRIGWTPAAATVSALLALLFGFGWPATSAGLRFDGHARRPCATPNVSAARDPVNPLALPTPPSTGDPLDGAHFFVDGPKHGQAAGEIAQLLKFHPKRMGVDRSWTKFGQSPKFAQRFRAASRATKFKVRQLVKIANGEETQNVSLYAEGGGRGAIYGQTHKILCTNMRADPTPASVAVFSTYFIYPHGHACPSLSELEGWQGTFHRYVDEMARAINRRRAVILEEIDSTVLSSCLGGAALSLWEGDLRYESGRLSQLPHTVVYAEAGYSDARPAGWTARRLWQEGVYQVRGFFTNDTHFVWSSDENRWANQVVDHLLRISHGHYHARFVINTAQNGRGPKHNPHPHRQGNENLCNPPGRGLGRIPTGDVHPTFDGLDLPNLDGFLWTGVPGRSHNSSCPGGPWKPAGVFDPRFALELAAHANQKLGPGYPSRGY